MRQVGALRRLRGGALSDTRTVDVLVDLETADGLLSGQRMVCYLRVPGAADTE